MKIRIAVLSAALLAACSSTPPPTGCVTNTDCAKSSTGHVCSVGQCVACASTTDCPAGNKCSPSATCVQCLAGGDCMPGQKCVSSACVMGCDASNPCPAGKVCDPTLGACVTCSTSMDCKAPTPVCAGHACVGCAVDGDCMAGNVCQQGTCTMGCNGAHPQCGAGQLCDVAHGACVQCVADTDCASTSYCSGGSCLAGCRTNSDCSGQQCDRASHKCVACVDDTACGFGQVCSLSTETCVAGCNPQHPCAAGQGCCAGQCLNTQSDANNCGACGNTCASGSGCCGAVCVPLTTITNCGMCGISCGDVVSGTRACTAGKCAVGACNPGFGDCDKSVSNGCEVNLASDTNNCGACGAMCGTTVTNATASGCVSGKCGFTCNAGFKDCNGTYSDGCEVDSSKDVKNCGACGNACPTGVPCANGTCTQVSCAAWLSVAPTSSNGVYTIDPDGNGPITPFQVYCDMTTASGGWTLCGGGFFPKDLVTHMPDLRSASGGTSWLSDRTRIGTIDCATLVQKTNAQTFLMGYSTNVNILNIPPDAWSSPIPSAAQVTFDPTNRGNCVSAQRQKIGGALTTVYFYDRGLGFTCSGAGLWTGTTPVSNCNSFGDATGVSTITNETGCGVNSLHYMSGSVGAYEAGVITLWIR